MQHPASHCYSAERPVDHLSLVSCQDFCGNQKLFSSFPPCTALTLMVGTTLCIYTEGRKNILHLTYPTEESGSYKRTAQGKPYFPFYQM